MIVNGIELLNAAPIKSMRGTKVLHNGVSHGLSEVGYDIRIKQEVTFFPMDPQGRGPYVQVDGLDKWGRFTIASAMEEFDMPHDLGGIVHDKSTWARRGLSVFNTVVESGWKGHLTLELVYHGQEKLVIPAGSGIAQVVFHRTTCKAAYSGRYQHQADEPVAAIAS